MKKSLPLLEEQTLCWNNILLTNLLDDAKLDENFLQSLHSIFYLLLCVVGHKGKAHEGVLRSACGWNYRVDEYTCLECGLGNSKCLLDVATVERDDWTLCVTNLKALLAEACQGIAGNIPQSLKTLGLLLKNVKSLHGSCCGSGCVGCTEDICTTGVFQEIDGITV